uniref:Uncharacterized protein n=1 Tax=Aegilops tauschii subsp. strangulata TaxID=200361 RepID=A0A453T1E8_AEGTS
MAAEFLLRAAGNQVQRRPVLDVEVRQGALLLQVLCMEDEPLMVRREALLGLDHGLDVANGVAALHLKRDRLPGEGLDENLHLFFSSLRRLINAPSLVRSGGRVS